MLELGLAALAAELRARRVSARELCEQALQRADRAQDTLNAFVTIDVEGALRRAERADARLAAGDLAPLLGVPFAHKDNLCTRGLRTSCGSRMLDGFVPPYDSAAAERLDAAGAVCIGKCNLDEFGMGSSGENSHFGATRNPWDHERVPGGSSSGSAAAVAAGLVAFATGSDTGGSVRQPAAFCGLTGLKPTYGRISRWGLVAYASSLDCVGLLARSAEDCALLLQCLAGADPRDGTCAQEPPDDYRAALERPLQAPRVGIVTDYFGAGVSATVRECVQRAAREIEALGACIEELSLPSTGLAIPAYYLLAPAEASSNLARFDGVRFGRRCERARDLDELYVRSRSEGLGMEVQRRILVGTFALSAGYYDAYYLRALKARRRIADDFAAAFERFDVLLGPTAPTSAFRLGEKASDPLAMYAADINTVAASLAGLPAISVPCGLADGLPIGLQLIAPKFAEARLLQLAHHYQQASDWHRRCAPQLPA